MESPHVIYLMASRHRTDVRNETDRRIIDRYFEEILSDGDFAGADEILAPDFVIHGLQTLRDRESFIEVQQTVIREAFPDLRFAVKDVFGDGNKVAVRATIEGTHRGEYLGIAATGNQVEVDAVMLLRLSDGRIAEVWTIMDSLSWFQQLGAVPPLEWQGRRQTASDADQQA